MIRPTREQYATAHAVVAYIYNTGGIEFVRDVFGDVHPNYTYEKAEFWSQSPARAIGHLDAEHFSRFVSAAIAKHGRAGDERAFLAGALEASK